jgi:hypothetical protein
MCPMNHSLSRSTRRSHTLTEPGGKPIHAAMARWRSGYAAACKAVYTSSILVLASTATLAI